MKKLITIFILILIILFSFIGWGLVVNKDFVVYELESENKVFGYCSGYTCKGLIKTNTTINDIKKIGG